MLGYHFWSAVGDLRVASRFFHDNVRLTVCFVEASVDVTNNKWLLHTSSALIDWIEKPDPTGNYIHAYYYPLKFGDSDGDNQDIERDRTFDTVGSINYGGGKFPIYQ